LLAFAYRLKNYTNHDQLVKAVKKMWQQGLSTLQRAAGVVSRLLPAGSSSVE
jgi:hypothetical protein